MKREEHFTKVGKSVRNVPRFGKGASLCFSFQQLRLVRPLLSGVGAKSRFMMNSSERTRRRHQRLTWEVLIAFVIPLLELCTFSPDVHADLVRQLLHAHHTAATGHCGSPSLASQATAPLTDHHKSTPDTVCCRVMRAQQGRVASPVQIGGAPLLSLVSLPFDRESYSWGECHHYFMQVLHPLRPPSLYRLHTLLLV